MIRTGLGYDSHRFQGPGPLTLGGLQVPFDKGFAAHSDGDVVLHALTDALLGAIGSGDIGEHFPDTDPQWQDASSDQFVAHAMNLLHEKGYLVTNCDITIIAQTPKLSSFKQAITESIARLLQCDTSAVAVKAKTNEHMGFVGRKEGIAVLANVLLIQKTLADALTQQVK